MGLVEQMRKARESWATVEGFDFLIRRPTHFEVAQLREADAAAVLRACVVGWRNVKLSDLVRSEPADPAPFDAEALVEWVLDQPPLLAGLLGAVTEAIEADVARRKAAQKN